MSPAALTSWAEPSSFGSRRCTVPPGWSRYAPPKMPMDPKNSKSSLPTTVPASLIATPAHWFSSSRNVVIGRTLTTVWSARSSLSAWISALPTNRPLTPIVATPFASVTLVGAARAAIEGSLTVQATVRPAAGWSPGPSTVAVTATVEPTSTSGPGLLGVTTTEPRLTTTLTSVVSACTPLVAMTRTGPASLTPLTVVVATPSSLVTDVAGSTV